jgi:putative heme-binding domain-containing protein
MRHSAIVLLAACGLAFGSVDAAGATQAWVDPNLKVRSGLVLWLDAAVQRQAQQKNSQAPAEPGKPSGACFDGISGYRFDAPDADEQPTLETHRGVSFLRFDGRDDHLEADARTGERKAGLEFDQITVFVVAAPLNNEGDYPAMFAMHAWGAADYVTGMNIDQGFDPTRRFEAVNVEGAGSKGMKNLRTGASNFSTFQRICVTSQPGPQGVSLFVDGKAEGNRERTDSKLKADRIVLGGRFTGEDRGVRCFFAGDIAEVLVFDRVLSEEDRQEVDKYLAAKYANAGRLPPPAGAPGMRGLTPVESPPPVQMHVPGFIVRELPVQLPNINNVLYREDGAMLALAYDGDIYVLRDTDQDGLEDEAKLFWKNEGRLRAPVGMAITPPGYKHGRGVAVPSKAKCSLILDTNGDDVVDKEIVVAAGWPELPVGVDALGADFDPRDHSIYFGLGTTDFSSAYLLDENGTAHYDLKGEHGTILRIAPDLRSREIFATGIRFPVAIRFNKNGDLFCTDQEGATWLPNGNPFDELLHVRRSRHYGFPPRHPRHLPDVVDEPSLFDYRPQHQSTCGLNFNEPAVDGSVFGPDWWKSDALVTGFSRGKLYRTKLAQVGDEYVAQNQLIGTTNMMPSDMCVAPNSSAVVAMHSGGPDWGTGPAGIGKLYKVTYKKSDEAIPSLVWPQSPHEVRISFDRPVNPELLKDIASRIQIDGGEYVAAADRFESFRPGYAVVRQQRITPRRAVKVQNVQLTPDRRTLIVATAPSPPALNYSIALPGVVADEATGDALPQYPDIDLQYDYSGAEVTWRPEDGETWTGWLPHFDFGVARQFTAASAEHDGLWERMQRPGTIGFRTSLNLRDLLRPAVQPGAKLDYEPPAEQATLCISSDCPETYISINGEPGHWMTASGIGVEVRYSLPAGTTSLPVEIQLRHAGGDKLPKLSVTYHTADDPRPRPFPLHRLRLQWSRAEEDAAAEIVENRDLPELEGGDWLLGQKEFFGSTAGCSKCHAMRGAGGSIGPDLSNLPQRDYASVVRDVTQPSYAINPDFVAQMVLLQDGRTLAGTVRIDGERAIIADQEGKETLVPRAEIESLQHSAQSIMPEGIPQALGPKRLRDLLTFLLVSPPSMPVYGEMAPPQPRRMADVEAVLGGSAASDSQRPLHVVLIAGPKDHGPGEHDYPAWQQAWRQLFEMAEGVRVTTADQWPSANDLKTADALMFYQKGAWSAARANDVDAFLKRGGGISYIHYAVSGGKEAPGFAERIGLAWNDAFPQYRHGPLDVDFAPGKEHPIGRNFDKVHFYDESYWNSVGDPKRINLLATGIEEGQPRPLFWTREHGGGRIFVSIPGHYSWTFDDPLFRILLLRGLAWTVNEPVDRFNELALPGARIRQTPAKTENAAAASLR